MTHLTCLESGATVLTEHMPARFGAVLALWFRAGAAYDPPGTQGLSHLLEHMLFKGTEQRSALQLAVLLDAIGADLNATTDHEFAAYDCYLLGEEVAAAADVLCDQCLRSTLTPADLETERHVVLEELAAYEDSPEEVVMDAAAAALWAGHPLSHPVLGVREQLEAVDRPTLEAYWRARYQPGALVASAAGAVEHGAVVAALEERLGPSAGRPAGLDEPSAAIPQRATHALQRDTAQVYLCLASPAAGAGDPARFADAVLATALGGCPSSRLFQEIRERRGLAYHIESFTGTYRTNGALYIHVGAQAAAVPAVLELIRRELAAICREGLTEEELHRTRDQLVARVRLDGDSPGAAARRLGLNWLLRGELIAPETVIHHLQHVTGQDVVERARNSLADGPWVVAALGPVEEGALH